MDHEIDIARTIDHALLNPTATTADIQRCCNEAWQHNFPTVCVYPSAVREATEYLYGKAPAVCTV
ncbi:MAG: 2-deoxyribose-5-phosphate aldolase, partial [Halothece sp. Uz-M2-17]|nr:2-deoxyribose-5-phosphate aldolase [Halothece sp. Uz-M2-17]